MKIFPDLARQDEIKFLFAKGIPYKTRIVLIVLLLVVGLLVQLFYSFWLGLPLLALATGFSLVHGYDLTPEVKGHQEKWDQVTPDEYRKIKDKQKDLKRWDLDTFDITNKLGFAMFIISGAAAYFVASYLFSRSGNTGTYWVWDCLVLLAPHWVTGVKRYLRQDKLIIKIELLEKVMQKLSSPSEIQVLPMMATQTTKQDKRFPTDARLMLRMIGAPASFMGIQVQISINTVQGTDYPYLYCVLLARGGNGFFERAEGVVKAMPEFKPKAITVETTSEQGVDVLVIRQTTTKNSGYKTDPKQALFIVTFTLNLARRLCGTGEAVSEGHAMSIRK